MKVVLYGNDHQFRRIVARRIVEFITGGFYHTNGWIFLLSGAEILRGRLVAILG